ncbi:MAG: hypothetical protein IPK67_04685 [Planctomycetes bacterium]|nr:hypothetical protein [Planctomycetota bacterium]
MRARHWVLVGVGIPVLAAAVFVQTQIGWSNLLGMLRYDTRREGDLKLGDRAPAVVLHDPEDGAPVHLFDTPLERPVVLVFGSFT